MSIDTAWRTLYYGTDLGWYCGTTLATNIPSNVAGLDYAICRYRRVNETLTFQILARFGTGLLAALAAAGSGQWYLEIPPMNQPQQVEWALSSVFIDYGTGLPDPAPVCWATNTVGGTPADYVTGAVPPGTGIRNSAPFTWAAGDVLIINGSVEAFGN